MAVTIVDDFGTEWEWDGKYITCGDGSFYAPTFDAAVLFLQENGYLNSQYAAQEYLEVRRK